MPCLPSTQQVDTASTHLWAAPGLMRCTPACPAPVTSSCRPETPAAAGHHCPPAADRTLTPGALQPCRWPATPSAPGQGRCMLQGARDRRLRCPPAAAGWVAKPAPAKPPQAVACSGEWRFQAVAAAPAGAGARLDALPGWSGAQGPSTDLAVLQLPGAPPEGASAAARRACTAHPIRADMLHSQLA